MNIWTDDMMWKYMTVLVKAEKSHSMAIHSIAEPRTVKNCRNTLHLGGGRGSAVGTVKNCRTGVSVLPISRSRALQG